jgi:predicted DsbA family dithiol-disulfide isomerase
LNHPETLQVRVHYDFASTLCYVAHRTLARIAGPVAALGIEWVWTPLELARLLGPPRGGEPVDEVRRANAARVAAELEVPVRVPRVWPDVRALGAAALRAEPLGRGASWRERAFSAVFEEGRLAVDAAAASQLAHELGLELAPRAIEEALAELELATEHAREAGVTGVPTFMLGSWPFGGIQSDATMLHVLERYAQRARQGSLA